MQATLNAYDREKAIESIDKEITFTLDDIQNNDAVNTMLVYAFMIWFIRDSHPNDSSIKNIGAIATIYTAEGSQERFYLMKHRLIMMA